MPDPAVWYLVIEMLASSGVPEQAVPAQLVGPVTLEQCDKAKARAAA